MHGETLKLANNSA